MKKITLMVALVATMGSVNAQSTYKRAIGLRVSPVSNHDMVAASFKTFLTKAGALELNAGFGTKELGYGTSSASVSAAYQHHFPIGKVEGLQWFVGGGLSAFTTFSSDSDYKGFGIGLFPTGGADYKFKKIPLSVSADYRPTFLVAKPKSGWGGFLGDNFGIAARYTF